MLTLLLYCLVNLGLKPSSSAPSEGLSRCSGQVLWLCSVRSSALLISFSWSVGPITLVVFSVGVSKHLGQGSSSFRCVSGLEPGPVTQWLHSYITRTHVPVWVWVNRWMSVYGPPWGPPPEHRDGMKVWRHCYNYSLVCCCLASRLFVGKWREN